MMWAVLFTPFLNLINNLKLVQYRPEKTEETFRKCRILFFWLYNQYSCMGFMPESIIDKYSIGYVVFAFPILVFLKVWWHAATLFYLFLSSIHTILYIYTTHRAPLLFSSLFPLGRGPPLGCRAEIRTRACLTASRRAAIWITPHPISRREHNVKIDIMYKKVYRDHWVNSAFRLKDEFTLTKGRC